MRIAVIGAGFTGLTAALRLAQAKHEVVVFERETEPGGLAVGFKDEKWDWALERHYHHIFTSDVYIQKVAREVGAKYFFSRPKTSTYYGGKIAQLDSPLGLLQFNSLSLSSKIKTGVGLAYLRYLANWKDLEKITAVNWLKDLDREGFEVLWEPLLRGKFGDYAERISAAWFWARIKKRSASLGYFEGGFGGLARRIEKKDRELGVEFRYGVEVREMRMKNGGWKIDIDDRRLKIGVGHQTSKIELHDRSLSFKPLTSYDRVLVTGPSWVLAKLVPGLPEGYRKKLLSYEGLGAVNLVLALKNQFLADGTYWLNINDRTVPFLCVTEHTNFVDPAHYGGDKLLYVGNYLPKEHEFFGLGAKQLVDRFLPYLKKLNPSFARSWIREAWVFKAPFAQPIVTINYSKQILSFATPLPGLFWSSIQQVYPWDRGTNYAVEAGEQVAIVIQNSKGPPSPRLLRASKRQNLK